MVPNLLKTQGTKVNRLKMHQEQLNHREFNFIYQTTKMLTTSNSLQLTKAKIKRGKKSIIIKSHP